MRSIIDWFLIKPRYIDGELIENQWFWFGSWIVYNPDEDNTDPCSTYEVIYSNWRIMFGWYENKFFGQVIFNFWPYIVNWGIK